MIRINERGLYHLAQVLRPIETIDENVENQLKSIAYPLWRAHNQLTVVLRSYPFKVCRKQAQELQQRIEDIVPGNNPFTLPEDSANLAVDWIKIYHLKDTLKTFETVFLEELATLDIYVVAQKGAYSIKDLIECAEIMLPSAVLDALPDNAKKDWNEAGRCIAFETPTAAAFHLFRAVESVLDQYHLACVGREPTEKESWGACLNNIKGTKNAEQKVVDLLEVVKDNYRNPVAHPEIFVTKDEVLGLIGIAQSAISAMVEDIKTVKAKASAAPVAAVHTVPIAVAP